MDIIRISCGKLLKDKQWRDKQISMRRYFYGVKAADAVVQLLATKDGIPVESSFMPGNKSNVSVLKKLPLHVLAGS